MRKEAVTQEDGAGGRATSAAPRRAPDVVLEDVTKEFEGTVAVSNMSLEIDRGEFIALIGPSGCGKTTTLRMIGGFEAPTEGSIYIKGQPMNDVPAYERNTATVWQQFALFPHLNVQRNVEFGLRMQGVSKRERREKALAILEKVGLGGMAERDIGELSGGQQQRVGLARALVVDPAVLLLDEPLGSLDANLRVAMQSQLKALQRELGFTFVYVTHNQSEALAMADRIAVMNEGRIEQLGTPEQVFMAPQTKFVASFVGTNNILEGTVMASDGPVVSVECPAGVLRVVNRLEESPTVGTDVAMVVRADVIEVGAADAGDNHISGLLRGEEYFGSSVTLTVELDGGGTFKVGRSHREEGLALELNDRLTLSWSSEDTLLLPWKAG